MDKFEKSDADEQAKGSHEGWAAPTAAHGQLPDTWVKRRLKLVGILLLIGFAVALIVYCFFFLDR
jgi:hypothetical protein